MRAEQIAVLSALAVNGVYDLRKKEILFLPTVFFSCCGVIYTLLTGNDTGSLFFGLLPGVLLGVISLISRQAVGVGDAVMTMAVGIWDGWRAALFTLTAALAVQAGVSVIYRLAGGRKKELPFVPALLAGYVLYLVL